VVRPATLTLADLIRQYGITLSGKDKAWLSANAPQYRKYLRQ
jgi:hypothetical protein